MSGAPAARPRRHLANILHAIADDIPVQCRARAMPGSEWGSPVNPLFTLATNSNDQLLEWRIKPRTVTVNGVEVPAPLRTRPLPAEFWVADPTNQRFAQCSAYMSSDITDLAFARGLVYATEEDAAALGRAMAKPLEVSK